MKKENVLILGDLNSVIDFLDLEHNSYFLITDLEASAIPKEMQKNIESFYIDTPDNFDVSCFENNIDVIYDVVSSLIEKHGQFSSIVTTYEHTVLSAAMIRTRFNIPGIKESEAIFLRNKYKMKEKIFDSGILTPNFTLVDVDTYHEEITQFLREYGKIVIKPINQAASYGVLITQEIVEATNHIEMLIQNNSEVLIEEYLEHPIMHFDGVIQENEMKFFSVSKKIGNCYDYVSNNGDLCTIIQSDSELVRKAQYFTKRVLEVFKIDSLVFHLEVFADNEEFHFLEIAGRYPGGGISKLIKRAYDFDLVKASYLFDTQKEIIRVHKNDLVNDLIAMIIIPFPAKEDIIIRGISGLDQLPDNIIGSIFTGPGEIVTYNPFDTFKKLAEIYIRDTSNENIENTVDYINNNVNFSYVLASMERG
ncbi:hypothetical protein J32TS6_38980 [Virgibacillus pantothenticus]|uniref:ATP-grasp domain-containing protein n=1 Tax=Virgibacillus pantothenticus TaxID=1473 RepID=UPI001B1B132B|nr:hypothetical protein [Virgibacillus pantothenticus]MBU8566160.1 hypothetical protein [Virgibacillus pantothenticus]MBU8600544.1 hypothetical protein [Virgibacillus pantothenticus]MBU8634480.1 hypothetical protein [Virgibacillus pantothenticus]MBU8642683.1 hypothetical protein [Virgibacillus pantothenticus]MBU8647097.1 hypothetical protein [Virgibacillus pantothenticus]